MDPSENCTFLYDLFGTQITSKPFACKSIDEFKPERATAKIFTTPDRLLKFFTEKMKSFCIFVSVMEHYLAVAEIDLSKALKLNLEDLKRGKLEEFEGILNLEPVKQSPNEEKYPSKHKPKSESSLDHPHIGVRFSVGLHPDAGILLENTIKDQVDVDSYNKEVILGLQGLSFLIGIFQIVLRAKKDEFCKVLEANHS